MLGFVIFLQKTRCCYKIVIKCNAYYEIKNVFLHHNFEFIKIDYGKGG